MSLSNRAMSVSSTATNDTTTTTNANHESTILKPHDPSLTNSDDWPIFTIRNALVFDPTDPTVAEVNLLHAGAYRPLTVTGKLEAPPLDAIVDSSSRQNQYNRTQPIHVTDVTQFSYGQYEDGSVDIWAAGLAGWFTINPSRAYKHIYADMVQAVKLLYFIADEYKEVKRYSDLDARAILVKYWTEHPDTCSSIKDAEDLFARHRYFLFASMLDGKEGVQWTRAPFFKYYENTYPNDVALIRQRRAFSMKPPLAHSSKRSTHSPAPSNTSLKRKRKERAVTPSGVNASASATRSSSRSQSVATTASTSSAMDTPDNHTFTGRTRSGRGSRKPSAQPPSTYTPIKEVDNASDADSEESDGDGRAYKGKTRSALRPKPTKYVPSQLRDGNEADDDETETDFKGSSQLTPSSKRKMMDDLRSRRAKRRNSEMHVGDPDEVMGTDDADDQDEEQDSAGAATTSASDDPDAMKEEEPETLEPRLSLPVLPFRMRDSGKDGDEDDGDLWRCEIDGCSYKVYAASEPSSQVLVDNHQRTHEYDGDSRVQLIRRMEAPWLPVSRLMEKVRGLAAQNGTPAPVVQRY